MVENLNDVGVLLLLILLMFFPLSHMRWRFVLFVFVFFTLSKMHRFFFVVNDSTAYSCDMREYQGDRYDILSYNRLASAVQQNYETYIIIGTNTNQFYIN